MDTMLPPVPGIDHSLPPVYDAPLSALDDSRAAPTATPRTRKRARAPEPADTPAPQKRRRSFSYWSADELRRLLEAACMAGADFTRIAKLVQTRSVDMCRKQVRAVADRVVGPRAGATVDDCVRAVLNHLHVPPPPPRASRARVPSTASHRGMSRKVAIQVVPLGDADSAAVDALGRNPCVEVVLRASRSVWDVAAHLYSKWGHPLRLLAPDGAPLPIDDSVAAVCAAFTTPDADTVRLSYSILTPALDSTVMGNPGGAGVAVGCKSRAVRVCAPAPQSPLLSPPIHNEDHPPVSCLPPSLLDMPSSRSRTYAPRPRNAPDEALPFEGGLPPSPPPLPWRTVLPSRALPPRPPALLEDSELDASSVLPLPPPLPLPQLLPDLSTPSADLETTAEQLMGKWAARLQSLESLEENAESKNVDPIPDSFANTALPQDIPLPPAAPGRADSVLLAARALASETGTASRRAIGVQDFAQLSTSLFGNMFKNDSQPIPSAVPEAVPATRPLSAHLLSSDNALVMHDADDSGGSLPILPPRIESGFADPSLNFSLLFGDGMPTISRPENSGSVPS